MQETPQSDATPVTVVGSGPAGLAAAFRLRQAGLHVTIIEAAHVLGGKMRSKRRDGFLIDQGAFFIPTTHRRLIALAADAGFLDQLTAGGSILAIARDGLLHAIDVDHALRDVVRTRFLSKRAKLSLSALLPDLWRARRADYERIAGLGDLDIESADAWARRTVGAELSDNVVGLVIRAMSGATAETSSRVEFLALMELLNGARLLGCRGGMGAFAENLAAGIAVRLNARVLEVIQRSDCAQVTWRDAAGAEHVETVAGCIVAGSADTAVDTMPEMDAWRRQYLSRVRDRRTLIVNLALTRRPENVTATYILLPRSAHPFLSGICSDHHKAAGRAPGGKGLLSIMPVHEWGERRCEDSDEQIVGEALAGVDSVIPGVSSQVEFAEVTRWTQRYNPVGHYRELGRFRDECRQRDCNVQLAGDYFGYADLETAARSGEDAALALGLRLGRALE